MYKKLEELVKLNEEMESIVKKIKTCNDCLKEEYKQKEDLALQKFLSSMTELASFGKNIACPNCKIYGETNYILNWYSFNKNIPELFFEIDYNGNFKLTANPSGYSHQVTIYDSESDEWKWYEEESKKFIAQHSEQILDTIQNVIADKFVTSMSSKMEKTMQEQKDIILMLQNIE